MTRLTYLPSVKDVLTDINHAEMSLSAIRTSLLEAQKRAEDWENKYLKLKAEMLHKGVYENDNQ